MARTHKRSHSALRRTETERLSLLAIHSKLNELLDAMHAAAESCEAATEQISCLILEEDLRSLIEECEEYLLAGLPHGQRSMRSFLNRSVTVMEESCEVLKEGKVVALGVLRCARLVQPLR